MATVGPHFYNLTLSPPQSISHAIVGSFSGVPKSQEIVVARGTRIELLKPDATSGKIETVLEMEVFGTVRSLAGFRLTGGNKGECTRPWLETRARTRRRPRGHQPLDHRPSRKCPARGKAASRPGSGWTVRPVDGVRELVSRRTKLVEARPTEGGRTDLT